MGPAMKHQRQRVARDTIWAVSILLCAMRAAAQIPADPSPPLTNVQQVAEFGLDRARMEHPPVLVEGVVTFLTRRNDEMFIHDASAGVVVRHTNLVENRFAGQRVRVSGVMQAGLLAPFVSRAHVEVLGTGPMPKPLRVPVERLNAGEFPARWVEVSGVVRDVVQEEDFFILFIRSAGSRIPIFMLGTRGRDLPLDWLDASITLRGVSWPEVDREGKHIGTWIHVAATNFVEVAPLALTNAFEQTALPMGSTPELRRQSDMRRKIAGTVLYHSPGGRVFLRDETGAAQADLLVPLVRSTAWAKLVPRPSAQRLEPGDKIELVGAPMDAPLAPSFVDAEFRVTGKGSAPTPVRISTKAALSGAYEGHLVTLRGKVVGRDTRSAGRLRHETLSLEDAGSVFEVLWETSATNRLPIVPQNTLAEVTGICIAMPMTVGPAKNFRLVLRNPGEVLALGPAPWWSSLQPGRILAVSGTLGILALIWISVLRHQIAQRERAEAAARRSEAATRSINYFATALLARHTEEEILWDLARNCVSKLGFVDCVVYLVDRNRGVLVQKAAFGPKSLEGEKILNPITIPLGQGIVGSVARSGQPELISDTRKDSRYIVDDEFRLSEITVPIVSGDEVLGVIDSEHPDEDFFTQEHVEMLTAIASICANKLVRVRAEQKLRTLNRDLERRVSDRTSELASANAQLLKAEQELLKALAQEKELSELKSRFVSMVSHEFRTPLGIIMASAEILEAYLERLPEEERRSNLRDIFEATRQMSHMMEEALLLGRAEAGQITFRPAPLDLAVFCRRLINEVSSATGSRCPIQLAIPAQLPEANADESLLRHIFTNLLSNAVKYSPAGSPVEFTIQASAHRAVFVVRDRGIGIPEEDARQLFQAFHRGRNVGGAPGTGLGMAIVKRCVELHSGKIAVETREGAGTAFIVTLPLFGPAGSTVGDTTQIIRAATHSGGISIIS
jgi:signal transduction histidine kinase